MYRYRHLIALTSSLLLGSSLAGAGDLFAYAPSGRSEAQQQQDRYECHQWAVEQTKFDPVQLASQSAAAPAPTANPTSSNVTRGPSPVMTGAAQGALLSEAAKGEADRGAAVGAGMGLLRGRMAERKAAEEKAAAQLQAQRAQRQQRSTDTAQLQARQQEYQRARATCFRARGYTVSEG